MLHNEVCETSYKCSYVKTTMLSWAFKKDLRDCVRQFSLNNFFAIDWLKKLIFLIPPFLRSEPALIRNLLKLLWTDHQRYCYMLFLEVLRLYDKLILYILQRSQRALIEIYQ